MTHWVLTTCLYCVKHWQVSFHLIITTTSKTDSIVILNQGGTWDTKMLISLSTIKVCKYHRWHTNISLCGSKAEMSIFPGVLTPIMLWLEISLCQVKQKILSPKSGVAKLFSVKGQIMNILGFDAIRPLWQELCCCTASVATDNTQTNEHDCVPVKLYLWTLIFEFHIMLMFYKILVFGFQKIKSGKVILCS